MNISSILGLSILILAVSAIVISLSYNQPLFGIGDFIGAIVGFIISALTIIIPASLNVVGSGLNSTGTRILFAMVMGINILFELPITIVDYSFKLGLGLLSKILSVFPNDAFGSLIKAFYYLVSFSFLVSLVIIASGSGGEG